MGGVDKGIKLLTFSTSVRWFGWGIGETFIPVFLLLFSGSFFETGLLASVYPLVFLLAVPFAGVFADNFKAKYLILFAAVVYVFVGLGYFFAGVTGLIILLIVARGLSGVSASFDYIARDSFFIRHSSKKEESQVFGHFDKIANFWWIIGILIGLLLINYTEIHWLLLMIAPTSVIAFFIVLRLKEKPIKRGKLGNPYSKIIKEIRGFNKNLKKLGVIVFFFGAMSSIVYYFAPAVTYARGASLISSAVLILAYALPALFGERLGKFADRFRYRGYYLCLASLVFVLLVLAFSPNYYLLLLSMFFAGSVFELSNLTSKGFMARNSDFREIGEIDSALSALSSVGSVLGPILFGLLLTLFNPMGSYFTAVGFVLLMLGFVYRVR